MDTTDQPIMPQPTLTTKLGYRPMPTSVDLPALERATLARWESEKVFERSLAATTGGPEWVFYEGPPTANGMPGTHHVEARAFKDVFPRFRTMKGYHVARRAGWDCHGLPVELAVEKELGFSGKGDIETYGVAEFNARCRESVLRHVGAFGDMTRRMAYWVDMDSAYWTMNSAYIQSVWWSLKQVFDKGLLVSDYRITPYCPRCGTGLSDHELAQGYEDITDASVYVRFPVTSGPLHERFAALSIKHGPLSLLVWTTTPWTLVSNTAAAVNPDVDYAVVAYPTTADSTELLVLAVDLVAAVLGEQATVLAAVAGTDIIGTGYSRPFDWVEFPATDAPLHTVLAADFVTTTDGTGVVHEAPAFGAEDLALCRAAGLPVVNPVRADGTFEAAVPLVGAVFFKKADDLLVPELARRGLLFRHLPYAHSYPHCWRCHTPLIYYALPSWYIRTTAMKDALLAANSHTDWRPGTIQWGRFGDWLTNNVDWALSRSRYWGTPLPIWRNELDPSQLVCVGSLAELGELAGADLSELDPHRPFVDDVTFTVPGVDGAFRRVPEVIDCWYDSGAMPFAQVGYPHAHDSAEAFASGHPADYICEAIDQTRGWFYTLMAIGVLVNDQSPYKTVLCLGHILDENGRKMSKHLGNVLEPMNLMEQHGADAVRWFMLCSGSPWQARRVGHTAIADVVRRVLLTYWNTAAFLSLYGRTAGFTSSATPAPPSNTRSALDRWALSGAHRLAAEVDAAMEDFDTARAGKALSAYIDDLSNWYVRRSRRRFWDGDPAALATLHECLYILTLLLAPFTPFITEQVWGDLFASTSDRVPDSVHLAAWPSTDDSLVDAELAENMALVRRLVELGRGARAGGKVRTRQPLGRALVSAPGWAQLPAELRAEICEELNVDSVAELAGGSAVLVSVTVKPNFRALGKRFGAKTQVVAAAITAVDPELLVAALRAHGTFSLGVDPSSGVDSPVQLSLEELVVTETPLQGWAVAGADGETVALDLTLDERLVLAGVAREAVRLLQDARKSSGLAVTDRITVLWEQLPGPAGETAGRALAEHWTSVAAEVLALEFAAGTPAPGANVQALVEDVELGLRFVISRASRLSR